jgi:ABC-type transporter Mla subunit MlaD
MLSQLDADRSPTEQARLLRDEAEKLSRAYGPGPVAEILLSAADAFDESQQQIAALTEHIQRFKDAHESMQACIAALTAEKAALAALLNQANAIVGAMTSEYSPASNLPDNLTTLTAPLPAGEPRRTDFEQAVKRGITRAMANLKSRYFRYGLPWLENTAPITFEEHINEELACLAAPVIDREEGQ